MLVSPCAQAGPGWWGREPLPCGLPPEPSTSCCHPACFNRHALFKTFGVKLVVKLCGKAWQGRCHLSRLGQHLVLGAGWDAVLGGTVSPGGEGGALVLVGSALAPARVSRSDHAVCRCCFPQRGSSQRREGKLLFVCARELLS